MTRRPFAAGNWKMNGLGSSLEAIKALVASIGSPECDVAICPPATLLQSFAAATSGTVVGIGAQDCHDAVSGAHTGDISAEMIADAGAAYVIVGHSERRADHGETDADVAAKAEAVWRAGLVAIVCVGETEAERDAGAALDVVAKQLSGSLPDGATGKNTVVAYEPVWAIGTGRTPSLDDIAEVHAAMRSHNLVTKDMRLLYGGSVKPANAAEIFAVPDVDGGLVGGASLKPADFAPIVAAASAAAR